MITPVEFVRRQWSMATHHLTTMPVLVLMPHGGCNCRCVMCDIWKANAARIKLSVDEIAIHLDAFDRLRVKWVVLSGGEALLHPNLWTLCELLKLRGIRITLLSTGLLLAKEAANVVRFTDEAIVSLDGPREVHDSVRQISRAYDRLKAGIEAVHSVSPDFPIAARSVIQHANWDRLDDTVEAARDLGVKSLSFLNIDTTSEAFNRPGGWQDDRVEANSLSGEEAQEFIIRIEPFIRNHQADIESGFVVEKPAGLRRLAQYFLASAGLATFPNISCNAPWVSSVIEADGTVRPCFFQPAYGNLRDGPLDTVVNSNSAIDFRKTLDIGSNAICERCVCTLTVRSTQVI